jgi:hypothetical protein
MPHAACEIREADMRHDDFFALLPRSGAQEEGGNGKRGREEEARRGKEKACVGSRSAVVRNAERFHRTAAMAANRSKKGQEQAI